MGSDSPKPTSGPTGTSELLVIQELQIANFSPQAEEAKQCVIQAAAKIKNASIQEFVRRVLAVGKLCGLLIERISTANRHPWGNSRRWRKLQAETGSNIERCIVLR
jgi:hypothetical protein